MAFQLFQPSKAQLEDQLEHALRALDLVNDGTEPLSDSGSAFQAGKRRMNVLPGDPEYADVQAGNKADLAAHIAQTKARLAATHSVD